MPGPLLAFSIGATCLDGGAHEATSPTDKARRRMDQRDFDNRGPDSTSLDALDATEAVARMRRAVSAASIGACTPEELDAAAQALVNELRAAQHPPEQVLLHVKRILAQAGLRPSHGPSDPAVVIERHATVYRNVIESSIRFYFGRSESRDGDGHADRAGMIREIPRET